MLSNDIETEAPSATTATVPSSSSSSHGRAAAMSVLVLTAVGASSLFMATTGNNNNNNEPVVVHRPSSRSLAAKVDSTSPYWSIVQNMATAPASSSSSSSSSGTPTMTSVATVMKSAAAAPGKVLKDAKSLPYRPQDQAVNTKATAAHPRPNDEPAPLDGMTKDGLPMGTGVRGASVGVNPTDPTDVQSNPESHRTGPSKTTEVAATVDSPTMTPRTGAPASHDGPTKSPSTGIHKPTWKPTAGAPSVMPVEQWAPTDKPVEAADVDVFHSSFHGKSSSSSSSSSSSKKMSAMKSSPGLSNVEKARFGAVPPAVKAPDATGARQLSSTGVGNKMGITFTAAAPVAPEVDASVLSKFVMKASNGSKKDDEAETAKAAKEAAKEDKQEDKKDKQEDEKEDKKEDKDEKGSKSTSKSSKSTSKSSKSASKSSKSSTKKDDSQTVRGGLHPTNSPARISPAPIYQAFTKAPVQFPTHVTKSWAPNHTWPPSHVPSGPPTAAPVATKPSGKPSTAPASAKPTAVPTSTPSQEAPASAAPNGWAPSSKPAELPTAEAATAAGGKAAVYHGSSQSAPYKPKDEAVSAAVVPHPRPEDAPAPLNGLAKDGVPLPPGATGARGSARGFWDMAPAMAPAPGSGSESPVCSPTGWAPSFKPVEAPVAAPVEMPVEAPVAAPVFEPPPGPTPGPDDAVSSHKHSHTGTGSSAAATTTAAAAAAVPSEPAPAVAQVAVPTPADLVASSSTIEAALHKALATVGHRR